MIYKRKLPSLMSLSCMNFLIFFTSYFFWEKLNISKNKFQQAQLYKNLREDSYSLNRKIMKKIINNFIILNKNYNT